jgi:hypothetical protein
MALLGEIDHSLETVICSSSVSQADAQHHQDRACWGTATVLDWKQLSSELSVVAQQGSLGEGLEPIASRRCGGVVVSLRVTETVTCSIHQMGENGPLDRMLRRRQP